MLAYSFFAGIPNTVVSALTFLTTTLDAPIVAFWPICLCGRMLTRGCNVAHWFICVPPPRNPKAPIWQQSSMTAS